MHHLTDACILICTYDISKYKSIIFFIIFTIPFSKSKKDAYIASPDEKLIMNLTCF